MKTRTPICLPDLGRCGAPPGKPEPAGSTGRLDRLGLLASAMCGLHCMAGPAVLLLAPAWAGWWGHPASHWGLALLVLPVAAGAMSWGYRRHRRRWVLAAAAAGALCVMLGLVASAEAGLDEPHPLGHEAPTAASASIGPAGPVAPARVSGGCCPLHPQARADTGWSVAFAPLFHSAEARWTVLGSLLLIAAHLGNACALRSVRDRACDEDCGCSHAACNP